MKILTRMTMFAGILLTMAAGQAMAADSVDVKVGGTIVPPACVPAVSGGAVFDYGAIKAASLAKDDYTMLPQKSLTFTLTCDSPMKVAFKSLDARKGTQIPAPDSFPQITTLSGLGSVDNKNVGCYQMNINADFIKVDGVSSAYNVIRSNDKGKTWMAAASDYNSWLFLMDDGYYYSIASKNGGDNLPVPLTTMSGTINMSAALNKASELDLTKLINLDGQTTLQIVYL